MNNSKVIGVKRLTPIIDFNCIVDTDYGLLQLIYDQYYDLSVFNKEKFEMPSNKILLELYNRKSKNPLIPFINENITEEDVDEYYKQFIESQYEEVLHRSCGTNMQMLIDSFNKSGEVFTSILCHNETEKKYISELNDFKSNKVFMDEEFIEKHLDFNQIYLKYIDDLDKYLKQCVGKTIYLSSCGLNMEEVDGEIYFKKNENLKTIAPYSHINIYDLYNIDFLKGET